MNTLDYTVLHFLEFVAVRSFEAATIIFALGLGAFLLVKAQTKLFPGAFDGKDSTDYI